MAGVYHQSNTNTTQAISNNSNNNNNGNGNGVNINNNQGSNGDINGNNSTQSGPQVLTKFTNTENLQKIYKSKFRPMIYKRPSQPHNSKKASNK